MNLKAQVLQEYTACANVPFNSEHPGGTLALRADGTVLFMPETMDFIVQRCLAQRDDGQGLPDDL